MIRNKVFRFVCKSGNTFIVLPLCDFITYMALFEKCVIRLFFCNFILTVLLDICMCVMIYL